MLAVLKENRFFPFFRTLFKALASSVTGSIVDYSVMICLTRFAGVFYVYSIWAGGFAGAIVNYTINRYWTFKTHTDHSNSTIYKFAVMVIMSVLLKSAGTYALVNITGLDYKICRFCTDVVVSIGFNFMLQKYWVFKVAD